MNAIDRLLDIPQRNSGREFLIDTVTGQRLTFDQLHDAGLRVAADLRRRGIDRGERLAILLNNSAEFVKLYFGCLYAGVVTVPVNPILGAADIDYILRHSGAKGVVVSPETLAQIDAGFTANAEIAILTLLDGRGRQEYNGEWETWDLSALPESGEFVPFSGVSSEDTMTIVYTSGTTARPSGVAHRIADMVDNARSFNGLLGIGPGNRFYGALAMTYLGGYYNLLVLPYVGESSMVLGNAFDARSALNFWRPVYEHGVNTLWLVPTIISILMSLDRGHGAERYCRENIQLAVCGTAPLPVKMRQDFEERYGITLYENYGLTETFFITTNAPEWPIIDGGVGYPLPGVQVNITDESGNILPYGEEGEIHVRTPYLMQEYHESGQAEGRHYSPDDLFATGDVGILSPITGLSITGRVKDLIIRGGINISPAAIENVLYQHSAVAECAVVGIPHAHYGEDVAAVVRLAAGQDFSRVKGELDQLCRDHLARIKQPAQIVEIREFPHSSSGKIQKDNVRNFLREILGTGTPPT